MHDLWTASIWPIWGFFNALVSLQWLVVWLHGTDHFQLWQVSFSMNRPNNQCKLSIYDSQLEGASFHGCERYIQIASIERHEIWMQTKIQKRREKHFETNWKISSIVFRRNGKKANFNCFETSWKSIVCLMTELFSQFKLRLFTVSDYLKSTRLIIFKTLAAFFLSLLHQKQWNYGKMATVRNELKREREMRKILRNQWTKKIEIKWNF